MAETAPEVYTVSFDESVEFQRPTEEVEKKSQWKKPTLIALACLVLVAAVLPSVLLPNNERRRKRKSQNEVQEVTIDYGYECYSTTGDLISAQWATLEE